MFSESKIQINNLVTRNYLLVTTFKDKIYAYYK